MHLADGEKRNRKTLPLLLLEKILAKPFQSIFRKFVLK